MKSRPVALSVAPQTLPPISGRIVTFNLSLSRTTAFHVRHTFVELVPSKKKYGYRISEVAGTGSGSKNGYVGISTAVSVTVAAPQKSVADTNAPAPTLFTCL